MQRIGIRELRQHASRWVARAARGESFEVTLRGQPVAMLVPRLTGRRTELMVTGELAPARNPADLLELPRLQQRPGERHALSRALSELRADER